MLINIVTSVLLFYLNTFLYCWISILTSISTYQQLESNPILFMAKSSSASQKHSINLLRLTEQKYHDDIMHIQRNAYLVWTQSIGLPTYWRVVTAMENVTSRMTVALLCRRNINESMVTWLICKILPYMFKNSGK